MSKPRNSNSAPYYKIETAEFLALAGCHANTEAVKGNPNEAPGNPKVAKADAPDEQKCPFCCKPEEPETKTQAPMDPVDPSNPTCTDWLPANRRSDKITR